MLQRLCSASRRGKYAKKWAVWSRNVRGPETAIAILGAESDLKLSRRALSRSRLKRTRSLLEDGIEASLLLKSDGA
jgi:hypothetical protein